MNQISNEENKRPLDIYYYIDLNPEQDINIIERCLHVNLSINNKEYKIDKFVNCNYIKNNIENDNDVIKRGLITFNNMVSSLKLKSPNETWLFYISNGSINNLYKDVFVILLNKEPMFKKSNYVINKQAIHITKELSKENKMENIKMFNKDLQELLRSEKQITYTNLD
jgi:hypothetical protein